jgi:hypothetical protein
MIFIGKSTIGQRIALSPSLCKREPYLHSQSWPDNHLEFSVTLKLPDALRAENSGAYIH